MAPLVLNISPSITPPFKLDKLKKYYDKFDEKPAYILALSTLITLSPYGKVLTVMITVLHPYYKLDYIKHAWGGEMEQKEQQAAGNFAAKNWHDEALKIFEQTVSITDSVRLNLCSTYISPYQAKAYWKDWPDNSATDSSLNPSQDKQIILSDFDQHHQSLLNQRGSSTMTDTCGTEVQHYLKEVEDVGKAAAQDVV